MSNHFRKDSRRVFSLEKGRRQYEYYLKIFNLFARAVKFGIDYFHHLKTLISFYESTINYGGLL